ncbi:MAG: addiction module antidote protein [Solimonas sp.]
MELKTTKWDVEEYLKTDEDIAAYLDAALEESKDDPAFILVALGDIAKARGMSAIAGEAEISRKGLYKALSTEGNPSFANVVKIARALGLELSFRPAA